MATIEILPYLLFASWENFIAASAFSLLYQNSLRKNLISRGFWKVHNIAFKNFCMGRENFFMLQKFCTLVLQPRKRPLLSLPLDYIPFILVSVTAIPRHWHKKTLKLHWKKNLCMYVQSSKIKMNAQFPKRLIFNRMPSKTFLGYFGTSKG